ncbi:MAG: YvcK family protein, partial [bacterium]|nr:YvcK family protein [bacterium]
YTKNITVVVSMADDGGSAGRLRRLYDILPPGDIVSCMTAFCKNEKVSKLLTYRFPGDRYGKDNELPGQKLGNLIMVALYDQTRNFDKAISLFQEIFSVPGTILPATLDKVHISAITSEGKEIFGEEKIDLGKYNGERVLEKVSLHPKEAKASDEVIKSLETADVIIAGPGDLYTTTLPVLIVRGILEAIQKSKASKIFVVNVANKPFETKGYNIPDYIDAVEKHLGVFPFETVIANSNTVNKIPKKYNYKYVGFGSAKKYKNVEFINKDVVNEDFPLYHSPEKLAKAIIEKI